MNFELKSFSDDQALCEAAARDWVELVQNSTGPHRVAVSGGRIAKTFFIAVTNRVKASGVNLNNVHFFWADERCVDPSHPDSNFRLAWENLLVPLKIAVDKIHRLKGEWIPMASVAEANQDIRQSVPLNDMGTPVMDLIFLGLGENGHIASLMPDAPPSVAESREPYAYVPDSPKPPPDRITMTYPVLAVAKRVWMLAAGSGKTQALKDSIRPDGKTPFARVLQSRSQTVIYTDIPLNETKAAGSK